jgi:hypothetical protein
VRNTSPADVFTVQRRAVRFLTLVTVPSCIIKVYDIAIDVDRGPVRLGHSTIQLLTQCLSATATSDRGYGVAFLTLQDDSAGRLTSLRWWVGQHELRHRAFIAPFHMPDQVFPCGTDAYFANVWDLAVIAFERDAWIRCVRRGNGLPDTRGYLGERIEGDV